MTNSNTRRIRDLEPFNGVPSGTERVPIDLATDNGDTLSITLTQLASIITMLAGGVPITRRIDTSGLAQGGGSLGGDLTITVPAATGAQAITGTATDRAVTPAALAAALGSYIKTNLRGSANGVAGLDGTAKVPLTNIPGLPGSILTSPIDPSNLPVIQGNATIFVSTLSALTTDQQAAIVQGTRVIVDAGQEYAYKGTGPKTASGSYTLITASATVTQVAGKTGAVTLMKEDVGLDSVDNTADASKPVSSAQAMALALKADALALAAAVQPLPGLRAQNLLPNTRFDINSALDIVQRPLADGSGLRGALAISGYTSGSNNPTFNTSYTGDLRVGGLVSVAGVDVGISGACLEVLSFTSTTFTARLPLGLTSTSQGCTAYSVTVGDLTGITGAGPDHWSKTVSAYGWIEEDASNLLSGETRCWAHKKTSAGDASETFSCAADPTMLAAMRGKTIVFGVAVKHTAKSGAGTWRPFVVASGAVTFGTRAVSQSYTWIEMTINVPADATNLTVGVSCDGAANDVYHISRPMLALGNYLGPFAYSAPAREVIVGISGLTPSLWNALTFTFPSSADASGQYGFEFNLYQECKGRVSKHIRQFYGLLEGRTGNPGRGLGFRRGNFPPIVYDVALISQVSNVIGSAPCHVHLDDDAKANCYSSTPGDTWAAVSWDISSYERAS